MVEIDIAKEVLQELRQKGCLKLQYSEQKNQFVNEQYDDIHNDTIQQAENLYGLKLQKRLLSQTENKLKEKGYITSRIIQDNKTKIIAKKRVYA
jgi:hypothetical protein